MALDRRTFLKSAASAATALGSRRLLAAGRAAVPAESELVRLVVEADREPLLEHLVGRIRAGLEYLSLLGAVAEAAARAVQPYPNVGYKYHAFMVLQAVNLCTAHGRPENRWLPILWAADVVKVSQAAERRQGTWSLGPVVERRVPRGDQAERAFVQAMDQWDPEAADAAVVGMLRTLPRERMFETLFRYGARDLRSIGHKSITVANCHRLMRVVGAEHFEPMLRSLVLALQNHEGEPNPAGADLVPDRPWRRNLLLSKQRPSGDQKQGARGTYDAAALLGKLRAGSEEQASRAMREAMDRGASAAELWTAIFAAAGDLMCQQSGIISVHANTTSNALYYAYRHVADPAMRRLLLLQAAAFLPMFRELLDAGRPNPGIDTLEAMRATGDEAAQLDDIFAEIGTDRVAAARKTLGYLQSGGAEAPFMRLARHYTVDRNVGYHDYKFTEAAFESAATMRSPWRERYLASAVLYLNGSNDKPDPTVARARVLLG